MLAAANDPKPYDETREYSLTRKDVLEQVDNLEQDRIRESRELLGRFVDEIRVRAAGAAVHYSIPLPEDSPLAGMRRQEIDLPQETLA